MRWFSLGAVEVGVSPGRLVVALVGARISKMLVDWSW